LSECFNNCFLPPPLFFLLFAWQEHLRQNQTTAGGGKRIQFRGHLSSDDSGCLARIGVEKCQYREQTSCFCWVHRVQITLVSLQTGWTFRVSLPSRFVCAPVFAFCILGFFLDTAGFFFAFRMQVPVSQFAFLQSCSILSQTLLRGVFLRRGFG